jgi:hypothetical protein
MTCAVLAHFFSTLLDCLHLLGAGARLRGAHRRPLAEVRPAHPRTGPPGRQPAHQAFAALRLPPHLRREPGDAARPGGVAAACGAAGETFATTRPSAGSSGACSATSVRSWASAPDRWSHAGPPTPARTATSRPGPLPPRPRPTAARPSTGDPGCAASTRSAGGTARAMTPPASISPGSVWPCSSPLVGAHLPRPLPLLPCKSSQPGTAGLARRCCCRRRGSHPAPERANRSSMPVGPCPWRSGRLVPRGSSRCSRRRTCASASSSGRFCGYSSVLLQRCISRAGYC